MKRRCNNIYTACTFLHDSKMNICWLDNFTLSPQNPWELLARSAIKLKAGSEVTEPKISVTFECVSLVELCSIVQSFHRGGGGGISQQCNNPSGHTQTHTPTPSTASASSKTPVMPQANSTQARRAVRHPPIN